MSKGYQLKITIKGSKPPIWRRVIVPDKITFRDLDDIIEELFGWMHEHLFQFSFGQTSRFTGSPNQDPEDTADEYIDEWMEEDKTFTYVYDFGDDWIHTIKVEKILEREARYPEVLKSKGPYMIEDCGGLWGFYEHIDEAEPFDVQETNKVLAGFHYPDEFDENADISMENLKKLEDSLRSTYAQIDSLRDIFIQYPKNNLVQIAQLHNFRRYSKLNKGELAEWLKNHLLETVYMKEQILKCTEMELDLFERAITKNGIIVPVQFVENSLLLCTYAGYNDMYHFLQIPLDVQEKYKKICTPEFRQEIEQHFLLTSYCNAAIYLYGVITKKEILDIYRKYEKKEASEKILDQVILQSCQKDDGYILADGYLMDDRLYDDTIYRYILEEQKEYPRYFPDSREEILAYGNPAGQYLSEDLYFFAEYLEKSQNLEPSKLTSLYLYIIDSLRMNREYKEISLLCLNSGCKLITQKKIRELMSNLDRLDLILRKWEFNGHNKMEISPEEPTSTETGNAKILPFKKEAKIYPNDPCPCGSGKKYKHCCGKNNPDK